jgi:hypothetical protein
MGISMRLGKAVIAGPALPKIMAASVASIGALTTITTPVPAITKFGDNLILVLFGSGNAQTVTGIDANWVQRALVTGAYLTGIWSYDCAAFPVPDHVTVTLGSTSSVVSTTCLCVRSTSGCSSAAIGGTTTAANNFNFPNQTIPNKNALLVQAWVNNQSCDVSFASVDHGQRLNRMVYGSRNYFVPGHVQGGSGVTSVTSFGRAIAFTMAA